jgi:hypothetical protein
MTSNNDSTTAYLNRRPSQWDFLPTAFSGAAGVLIGLAIANFLGWF